MAVAFNGRSSGTTALTCFSSSKRRMPSINKGITVCGSLLVLTLNGGCGTKAKVPTIGRSNS